MEGENITLRSLLNEISHRCSFNFFGPKSGQISPYIFELLINGRDYRLLPKSLDAEVCNGIEVEVNLLMLGGR